MKVNSLLSEVTCCHNAMYMLYTVVAASQSATYGTSQTASYAAVPGASPYGATQTVVTPGGAYAAPSGEQQYAQAAFGQPGRALYHKTSICVVSQGHEFPADSVEKKCL